MAITNRTKNQHLLWRAAFGPMAEMAADLDKMPQEKLWKLLVKTSENAPEKIGANITTVQDLMQQESTEMTAQMKVERGQQLRRQSVKDLRDMNIEWLDTMVNSAAQLREKLALFWHGHFATRQPNSLFQREILHIIRSNALGNFGTMLKEVSKSAAMLQFLNNQQNRKRSPNENFARELMELFTLGRGHYTEKDIKESARAFTGWGFNQQGAFVFRSNLHDSGTKEFLGQSGNFTGDDILNIILNQPQTARFITTKLYKYFVHEVPDEKIIEPMAKRFFQNKYELLPLLTEIFTSPWFYDKKNIGVRIKSPVELIAGIRRYIPLETSNPQKLLSYQRLLGQVLFYPPNVAGWPGGTNWIDSSSLMIRLQMPQVLTAQEAVTIQPKTDDDVAMGMYKEDALKSPKNKPNQADASTLSAEWQPVFDIFKRTKTESLVPEIQQHLLQTQGRISQAALQSILNTESRETLIKSAIVNIMSTPEYQLC